MVITTNGTGSTRCLIPTSQCLLDWMSKATKWPHETLWEAAMMVAELAGREAELRFNDTPKVNVNWIEELVADKGYHSGAVVTRVKNYKVRSHIPEKTQKGRRHWHGKDEEQQAVY